MQGNFLISFHLHAKAPLPTCGSWCSLIVILEQVFFAQRRIWASRAKRRVPWGAIIAHFGLLPYQTAPLPSLLLISHRRLPQDRSPFWPKSSLRIETERSRCTTAFAPSKAGTTLS